MLPKCRLDQMGYNKSACEWLARAAGARFWGWEIVVVFCGIAAALDGYAVARGRPAPKSRGEGRAVVERYLPHLVDPYDNLYTQSLRARYGKGYAMAEKPWLGAARCRGALAGGMAAQ